VSGDCTNDLPWEIERDTTRKGVFAKTPHSARGAVGVLTYKLSIPSGKDQRLAVMFSVPYDFNLYCNWFAVGVFDENQSCDCHLYYEMYHNSSKYFMRAKGGGNINFKHEGVVIEASMTDTKTPKLTVKLTVATTNTNCS